jgi:predicted regulator of Ras-like GTPase activity (Roadblock/LC7/MglB family)
VVKKEKVNATELELVLKDLVATEGVNASAVVTRDGVLVAFCNKHVPEMVSPFSSVVAMMTRTAEKCTRILKKGELIELITKADNGVILTEKYEEFIFLVAADKGFDFESIKQKMVKVKDAVRGIV